MIFFRILFFFGLVSVLSCRSTTLLKDNSDQYGRLVDTRTKDIERQKKQIFTFEKEQISFSNLFDGARLNEVTQEDSTTYRISIRPENTPINSSPWYSFKVWTTDRHQVELIMDYGTFKHRYPPKVSHDGIHWMPVDSTAYSMSVDSLFSFSLELSTDTLWISAQELFTDIHLKQWLAKITHNNAFSSSSTVGLSTEGRPIKRLQLTKGKTRKKPTIVFFSRQHPPEVTGQFALNTFVEAILEDKVFLSRFLDQYNILVYPMLNPDGVAMGHWRHNSGGVDPNRDWALYKQAENKLVATDVHQFAKKNKSKIVLGIDFHSTWYDVFYTNKSDTNSSLPTFTNQWLESIKNKIEDYEPKIAPSNVGAPVSKNWFYIEFNAVGITYEIGDNTPRDFIELKSKIAAREMMRILLEE